MNDSQKMLKSKVIMESKNKLQEISMFSYGKIIDDNPAWTSAYIAESELNLRVES